MINLLPTELKRNIMYARRNSVLLNWSVALLLVISGMGAIVVAGQFYMRKSIKSYSIQVEHDREQLKTQKLEETEKKLEDISGSLKLVIQVLSREVLFSKLLRQLGASIPSNAVLLQLQIDKLQGGVTLRAGATDIGAATQLQLNLQDPTNKIFDKADIESITCTAPDPKVKYPCVVQIKALFTKNNPFLFISKSAGGGSN